MGLALAGATGVLLLGGLGWWIAVARPLAGWEANRWIFDERATKIARGLIRPARGAVFSACAYNLQQGPLRVTAEPWGGPLRVAVYDASKAEVFTGNERADPEGVDFVLALKGQATPHGSKVAISPSQRGVVLDRRIALTAEQFAAADKARRGNSCGVVGLDFPAVPRR